MPDFPSAEVLFAAFQGRIYCATREAEPKDPVLTGYGRSDGAPNNISISAAGVEVETMLMRYPPPHDVFVHSMIIEAISNATFTRDLTFPLTLTVERSKQKIPVDGHDHIFTTYTCGNALRATARVGKLHLRLRSLVAEFQSEFAIRSISQAELERLVEEHPAFNPWQDRIYGEDRIYAPHR
jgi:hypothetical protein